MATRTYGICKDDKCMNDVYTEEETNDLLANKSDVGHNHAGVYQPVLGYTPVRQGGGTGQGSNALKIGWASNGVGIKAQVDATDMGYLLSTNSNVKVLTANVTSNGSLGMATISYPSGFTKSNSIIIGAQFLKAGLWCGTTIYNGNVTPLVRMTDSLINVTLFDEAGTYSVKVVLFRYQ